MTPGPRVPTFEELGQTLPVFPLAGVLLLPRGHLPLNIFEPRYLAMVDDALASDRMIGMIQPAEPNSRAEVPALYETGCAGRITALEETEDGRYLITLTGICRFRVTAEMPTTRGYRRCQVDWTPFRGDLGAPDEDAEDAGDHGLDRDRLGRALEPYFRLQGIKANWDAIAETPDERLVTSLAMICPFDPPEKQALLEAPDLAQRAEMMISLLEMAVLQQGSGGEDGARH